MDLFDSMDDLRRSGWLTAAPPVAIAVRERPAAKEETRSDLVVTASPSG